MKYGDKWKGGCHLCVEIVDLDECVWFSFLGLFYMGGKIH